MENKERVLIIGKLAEIQNKFTKGYDANAKQMIKELMEELEEKVIGNKTVKIEKIEEKSAHVETYAKTTRWVFTGWTPREQAEKYIETAPKVVIRNEYTVCYYENGDIERYKM